MSEVGGSDSGWMETPAQKPDPRQAAEQRAMQQMQLTREELRILKECNQESFWYRCVPLAIVGMTATQMAVNRGMLAPHAKYGALFKNLAAGLVGYVVGKVSYTRACKEKMMKLENSQLAEALRRQKYGRPPLSRNEQSEFTTDDSQPTLAPPRGPSRGRILQDDYSNLDVSSDANIKYKGLDDSFRPTLDSIPPSSRDSSSPARSSEAPGKPQISYDDLRRRHREEHQNRAQSGPGSLSRGQQGPVRPDSSSSGSPNYSPPPMREPPSRQYGDSDQARLGSGSRTGAKNKYGDTWD